MADPEHEASLRKTWRARWLGSLEELGDIAMQRATWLNPVNSNPHYSYVEYRECYFSDLDLGDGYASLVADGYVSPAEAEAVASFHLLFKAYGAPTNDGYDHAAILADRRWLMVADAARAAADQLAGLLADPEEIRHLRERSPSALQAAMTVNGTPT